MADVLLADCVDGVFTLTLNRDEKRNALNASMLDRLAESLARAELDRDVRAVVIRGAGRDFCAGADLGELLASVEQTVEVNERAALALGEIFLALRRLPKPTIAAVHGRALAGGAGLALACDVVVASEASQLGFPEIRRGFVPAMVMTLLRRAVGEKRAFELVATGRAVSAVEALGMGLVSRVFTGDSFDAEAASIARQLADHAGSAFALTKQLFVELDGRSVEEGILLGARVNAMARTTPDFRRAVQAFLDR